MTAVMTLFQQLNAPFPYPEYKYDSFGDCCYIAGQAVTERLNEVLGVGFWRYRGLPETEKVFDDPSSKHPRIKIYVEFSLYNRELGEWITFLDVGSEQIKPGMNEGDASKSCITDGLKKAASRIGVASDLYKGLITWNKQQQRILIPEHYGAYYEKMGWTLPASARTSNRQQTPSRNKQELTDKLKNKPTTTKRKIQRAWQELAGSLDGFEEWYLKKQQEKVKDQQMLRLLQRKLDEKAVSA